LKTEAVVAPLPISTFSSWITCK